MKEREPDPSGAPVKRRASNAHQMQPTKILQPARLQRSGCIAVAILGLFSLTGGSCQSVFNSGPTIVDAEKLPSSINYNSTNLVESCTSIPSSRYTQILNWHITYSDNTTADKPIFWPKGNTSPQPVYVYINSSDETIYEQSKNALNIWNAALNANAHGSVQIAYQTVSDPSAANVEIYDTSPDSEGGGIVGSEGNEVLSPDYSQLVSAKVFIETGQGTFPTFQIAVHELGHALGLDHNYYLRSVMFPILDTTGCSLKDPNGDSSQIDFADLSLLEASYDPIYCTPAPIGGDEIRRASRVRPMDSYGFTPPPSCTPSPDQNTGGSGS